MRIGSWNVNSVRSRLALIERFLVAEQPEVLALQETRCTDRQFPYQAFADLGYEAVHHGTGGHGGVALLSNRGLNRASFGFGGEHGPPFDEPRMIAADVDGQRVVSLYAPNGRRIRTPAWQFKLAWFELLRIDLSLELEESDQLIVAGDFNVCPTAADVYDPVKKRNSNLVSDEERERLRAVIDTGLVDLAAKLHPDETDFTWFSHMAGQVERNRGYRIDLVLASTTVAQHARSCRPLLEWRDPERTPDGLAPSDHAPVMAVFDASS